MAQATCARPAPRGVQVNRTENTAGEIDPRRISALTVIGDKVKNPEGVTLGKIAEVVLDLTSGTVSYVVLAVGGLAGLGDRFFAVPLEALTIGTKEKEFYLKADKKALKRLHGFDKHDWPRQADWPPHEEEQHPAYTVEGEA